MTIVGGTPRTLDLDWRMMPAPGGNHGGAASGIEGRMHTEYIIGAVKP